MKYVTALGTGASGILKTVDTGQVTFIDDKYNHALLPWHDNIQRTMETEECKAMFGSVCAELIRRP